MICDIDMVMIIENKTVLARYIGTSANQIIPETVNEIEDNAFKDLIYEKLKNIGYIDKKDKIDILIDGGYDG